MKRFLNLFILVCAVCISCNRTGDDNNHQLITVDIHQQGEIKDFIKSMDGYVFLETNDSSILQGIDKLKIEDDVIYIADGDVLQMFGKKDGKWLGKIDRQGRGPGEYMYINDFDVYESEIYVLTGDRIIVYDNLDLLLVIVL